MDHLPLTAPGPFDSIPPAAELDLLFPVPAPDGARPTEVMVWLPDEGERVVMHIVAAEEDAGRAVALAFQAARKLGKYEMTVRPF